MKILALLASCTFVCFLRGGGGESNPDFIAHRERFAPVIRELTPTTFTDNAGISCDLSGEFVQSSQYLSAIVAHRSLTLPYSSHETLRCLSDYSAHLKKHKGAVYPEFLGAIPQRCDLIELLYEADRLQLQPTLYNKLALAYAWFIDRGHFTRMGDINTESLTNCSDFKLRVVKEHKFSLKQRRTDVELDIGEPYGFSIRELYQEFKEAIRKRCTINKDRHTIDLSNLSITDLTGLDEVIRDASADIPTDGWWNDRGTYTQWTGFNLSLHSNNLTELPDGVFSSFLWKSIDLRNNRIERINPRALRPTQEAKCEQNVYLQHNAITALNEDLIGMLDRLLSKNKFDGIRLHCACNPLATVAREEIVDWMRQKSEYNISYGHDYIAQFFSPSSGKRHILIEFDGTPYSQQSRRRDYCAIS